MDVRVAYAGKGNVERNVVGTKLTARKFIGNQIFFRPERGVSSSFHNVLSGSLE
jgi:hypothetical protein